MPEKDRRSLHTGGCHCGNLKLQLRTELRPEEFEIRACQCSFCRKHATLAIADPQGEVELRVEEPEQLGRYSFGQRTIDFLLCRICGVYVGAVTRDGSLRALVIVNVLDSRKAFAGNAPLEVDYDAEVREDRLERRRTLWTPFSLIAEKA